MLLPEPGLYAADRGCSLRRRDRRAARGNGPTPRPRSALAERARAHRGRADRGCGDRGGRARDRNGLARPDRSRHSEPRRRGSPPDRPGAHRRAPPDRRSDCRHLRPAACRRRGTRNGALALRRHGPRDRGTARRTCGGHHLQSELHPDCLERPAGRAPGRAARAGPGVVRRAWAAWSAPRLRDTRDRPYRASAGGQHRGGAVARRRSAVPFRYGGRRQAADPTRPGLDPRTLRRRRGTLTCARIHRQGRRRPPAPGRACRSRGARHASCRLSKRGL